MVPKNSLKLALGDLLFGQQPGKTDPGILLSMTEFQPARCTVPDQHWVSAVAYAVRLLPTNKL